MDRLVTDGPLKELWAIFLGLADMAENGVIEVDDVLRELQGREIVDAAGYTWRIDPLTRSFVRRGPGEVSWRATDPEKYVGSGAPAIGLESDVTASPSPFVSSDTSAPQEPDDDKDLGLLQDLGFSTDLRNPAGPHRKRNLMLLIACGLLMLLVLVAVVVTHRPTRRAVPRSRSTPTPTPSRVIVIIPPLVTATTPSSHSSRPHAVPS